MNTVFASRKPMFSIGVRRVCRFWPKKNHTLIRWYGFFVLVRYLPFRGWEALCASRDSRGLDTVWVHPDRRTKT